jgi:hypothetical protein
MNYDEIDPGVRKLVQWLNENGFKTSDSGDGKSKLAEDNEGILDFPHVNIICTPGVMVHLANLLCQKINKLGIKLGEQGTLKEPFIQASYDPCLPDIGSIMLCNVDDAMLEEAQSKEIEQRFEDISCCDNLSK